MAGFDLRETFRIECGELLVAIESGLLRLEEDPADHEALHGLFRAVHTLKGAAGLSGFGAIERVAHVAENLLEQVRSGGGTLSAAQVTTLLAARDHWEQLAALDDEPPPELAAEGEALLSDLGAANAVADTTPTGAGGGAGAAGRWRIGFRPNPDVLQHGLDPLPFVRHLGAIGDIVDVQLRDEALPALADMEPETCYLGFEVTLEGELTREAIESVFEFVADDCELTIEPPAEAAQRKTAGAPAASGRKPATALSAAAASMRVDARKLDLMVNHVGELVTTTANIGQHSNRLDDEGLRQAVTVLTRLVEEVRDQTMSLRMIPIGESWERFRRVVRDVCLETGKEVSLRIQGADTEVDKSVVERIGDPLMHIVRNALDHGIEPPDDREGLGKPRAGTLTLNAYHDSGNIVIEVSDDGRGLSRERIRARAEDKGLIAPGQALADHELLNLVFQPGFSTAAKVTKLSGRGVGMDVVKRAIEALRGTVELESVEGQGSTVRIRLPLTLAIIDGFLVGLAGERYVVPLDLVQECIELDRNGQRTAAKRNYIDLRGEYLPYLSMRRLFGTPGEGVDYENIVIVGHGEQKLGLGVDELFGEVQAVVKRLGHTFQDAPGISGATILGDGTVALILDIPALIQEQERLAEEE